VFFVMGYNTIWSSPVNYRRRSRLLQRALERRITIEGTDVTWFAAVTKAMGEQKGSPISAG